MVNGKTLSRSSSTTGIVEAEHVASPDPPRRSNSRKSCSSASSTKKSRKTSNASSTRASGGSDGASETAERIPATTMTTTATTTLAASAASLPNSNVKSKSHRKSPFDRRGKHISHMFGAMIFNSLSLLSLLTVAITLTVLGFYVWAGVFYALSLLMLTKVGVDTTKEIRTEIKNTNKLKKKRAPTTPTTTTDGLNNHTEADSTTVDINDNADFSWQRLE